MKGVVNIHHEEKYEILENCAECGAKQETIEAYLKKGSLTKPLPHKEILKRLRDAVLPTKV